MLCVGCSGLDADPRPLDVYITYVRMHKGKVNTLCLWETSAVNKKRSSTIAGRDFFVLVFCFVFLPISQTGP